METDRSLYVDNTYKPMKVLRVNSIYVALNVCQQRNFERYPFRNLQPMGSEAVSTWKLRLLKYKYFYKKSTYKYKYKYH